MNRIEARFAFLPPTIAFVLVSNVGFIGELHWVFGPNGSRSPIPPSFPLFTPLALFPKPPNPSLFFPSFHSIFDFCHHSRCFPPPLPSIGAVPILFLSIDFSFPLFFPPFPPPRIPFFPCQHGLSLLTFSFGSSTAVCSPPSQETFVPDGFPPFVRPFLTAIIEKVALLPTGATNCFSTFFHSCPSCRTLFRFFFLPIVRFFSRPFLPELRSPRAGFSGPVCSIEIFLTVPQARNSVPLNGQWLYHSDPFLSTFWPGNDFPESLRELDPFLPKPVRAK